MPCIFHELTGFYCPGCGGTRAFLALITGHPILSFLYNPAVIYTAGVLLFYAVWGISYAISRSSENGKQKIRRPKFYLAFVWILIAILMINCTVRNLVLYFYGIALMPGV